MSDLIVIGYDSAAAANDAFKTVQKLQKDKVVDLTGLAVVRVDEDGKTHVDTPRRDEKVAMSATAGALWAMVIGLIIATPALGVVGAALGGLFGKLRKMGVDDKFRGKVESLLEPGSAAVVIMAPEIDDEKFTAEMRSHGGTVLKTSLDEEAEKELAEQLTGSD
ncbi:DUF1269 domain-containing protein [Streptomyces sp. NPDC057445]|uniref:DUF1269 domain-containing protein n=1 Tax=Streptomyces sp. NPDC057445 TaxID=3346136 RepID=UPI0036909074